MTMSVRHGNGWWVVMNNNSNKPPPTMMMMKPSTAHTYSFRRRKGRSSTTTSLNYSANQVEVVTACSWTELVVAADMPVVVEFWAPWCEPCRMLDEVANEYAGKALCYKLNVEDYPNIASQYGITSIPTVLFYDKGENKGSIVGVVPKSTICATIDQYVC